MLAMQVTSKEFAGNSLIAFNPSCVILRSPIKISFLSPISVGVIQATSPSQNFSFVVLGVLPVIISPALPSVVVC